MAIFGVSETARDMGIPCNTLMDWYEAGKVEKPEITIGKRGFYTALQAAKLKRSAPYAVLMRKHDRRKARLAKETI